MIMTAHPNPPRAAQGIRRPVRGRQPGIPTFFTFFYEKEIDA
jgi:hypothetical protein